MTFFFSFQDDLDFIFILQIYFSYLNLLIEYPQRIMLTIKSLIGSLYEQIKFFKRESSHRLIFRIELCPIIGIWNLRLFSYATRS